MKQYILLCVVSLFFVLFVQNNATAQCPPSTNTLTTYYATNNGQRGCMFNVTAVNDITVTCFDANLYSGTTADYEIYFRAGSFVGNENNSAAWTFVGSTTALTSAGNNVPTEIPIPVNVTIPAGQTYAFYVTNTFGGGTSYTDGTAANALLGSDANASVTGGVGKSYPFGLTFSFREFNGAIHYVPGIPLPVGLVEFWATPLADGVRLDWETATEENNDFFTVERSLDGFEWVEIGEVDGAGTSSEAKSYSLMDTRAPISGEIYYRLSQTDFDGATEIFDVRSVNRTIKETDQLIAYPNPASEGFFIHASPDELESIKVSDYTGKDLTEAIKVQPTDGGVYIDISALEPGLLIVSTSGGACRVICTEE